LFYDCIGVQMDATTKSIGILSFIITTLLNIDDIDFLTFRDNTEELKQ
jgi:hypothetical protein